MSVDPPLSPHHSDDSDLTLKYLRYEERNLRFGNQEAAPSSVATPFLKPNQAIGAQKIQNSPPFANENARNVKFEPVTSENIRNKFSQFLEDNRKNSIGLSQKKESLKGEKPTKAEGIPSGRQTPIKGRKKAKNLECEIEKSLSSIEEKKEEKSNSKSVLSSAFLAKQSIQKPKVSRSLKNFPAKSDLKVLERKSSNESKPKSLISNSKREPSSKRELANKKTVNVTLGKHGQVLLETKQPEKSVKKFSFPHKISLPAFSTDKLSQMSPSNSRLLIASSREKAIKTTDKLYLQHFQNEEKLIQKQRDHFQKLRNEEQNICTFTPNISKSQAREFSKEKQVSFVSIKNNFPQRTYQSQYSKLMKNHKNVFDSTNLPAQIKSKVGCQKVFDSLKLGF